MLKDVFQTLVKAPGFYYYSLRKLEQKGLVKLARLPYCLRVLLEMALRNGSEQDVLNLAGWQPRACSRGPQATERPAMSFFPARVLLQDLSGVPVLNDLAGLRAALVRFGGDPQHANPSIPVHLVIDHSLQVDEYGTSQAMQHNVAIEFQRNRERFEFLRWAQGAFRNLRIIPPASGIIHQVNVEFLAQVVTQGVGMMDPPMAYPDTVVGTDSHTSMVNGLGVLGWGVGGIEAIAAMLAQPLDILIPDVVGVRLSGRLAAGVTPTDLTLTLVQMLRKQGVVEKFVEFCGPGLDALGVPERAMMANMAPEYGATVGFFPVDAQTLAYLRLTGREAGRVEKYCRTQGLFRLPGAPEPQFSSLLELDLGAVEASVAGPRRPQERMPLRGVGAGFRQALEKPLKENGFGAEAGRRVRFELDGEMVEIGHGAVVIAAITSCTNTSNPYVMVAAGLLAQKARQRGLRVPRYVKTSLAPGSRVVADYLAAAGLLTPLEELGFHVVGFGCTTCIGNSGPLRAEVVRAVTENQLVVAAVLSGNRNFEGRISPFASANYLASPPLVVAYALAGRMDIDLEREPLGMDEQGKPVYLSAVMPTADEVQAVIDAHVTAELFSRRYAGVYKGNPAWNALQSGAGDLYTWDENSTYLKEPPFLLDVCPETHALQDIRSARVLLLLGDSVTTDHISPAGEIDPHGAAGQYLLGRGVAVQDFNTFGARRGHDEVLVRATFGNPRLKNRMLPGREGSFTSHLPDGEEMSVFAAARRYQSEGVPLLVVAGKEYGTGSSRDWAAKGARLLGVRAVLAESFERIHRSNLVGMGILPLQFLPGESAAALGLSRREEFDILGLSGEIQPGMCLEVKVRGGEGQPHSFEVLCRLDTHLEVAYYRQGGLLPYALAAVSR
jgi:aconitate hydratase